MVTNALVRNPDIGNIHNGPINSFGPDMNAPALHQVVQADVDLFIENGGLKHAVSAPMNPDRFQSTHVTPFGYLGVQYKAFDINGELMLEMNPVTVKGGQPRWFDVGQMPTADVVNPNDNGLDPQTSYVKSLVDQAVGSGNAKLMSNGQCSALQDMMGEFPSSVQSFDLTPRSIGANEKAYIVGGELYVHQTAMTFPATNRWLDCGPAPVALPR